MPRLPFIAALAAALWSGQAAAHARLIRATPRVGATVAQPPTELRLWFSETIELPRSSVVVIGPGGARLPVGPLRLDRSDPRVVFAPLATGLGPGAYRVEWTMTAADTHETYGDFKFTVSGPPKVR